MNPALLTTVQVVVVVTFAPLATGVVRRVKAFLQGRHGPPVLLPYWTLLTLMRKEMVLSTSTSWVFRAAPYVVLATALLSAAVLPLVARGGIAAPLSHMVVVAGIWMLGAVFLVLAGLFTKTFLSLLWSMPALLFPPGIAGGARGVINIIGSVGSFLGPLLVGLIATHYNMTISTYCLVVFIAIGAVITLFLPDITAGKVIESSAAKVVSTTA